MISKFVREQKRYTQQDLCSILECTESEVVGYIRKLKEYGVLKAVKASDLQKDLSELQEEDIEIADVEVGENVYLYVFTLIPDLITIAESDQGYDFIIFDAKYYNAKLEVNVQPKGQPGIESITKQYLYQLAYQKFIKDHNFSSVRNCFLLPTEVDHVIDKGEARMCILENLGLQNIKVRLLPAALAYAHYLSGRKMDIDKLNL